LAERYGNLRGYYESRLALWGLARKGRLPQRLSQLIGHVGPIVRFDEVASLGRRWHLKDASIMFTAFHGRLARIAR